MITVSDDRYIPALALRLRDEFPEVRYVPGPARGPSANRNHGASKGTAPWILFLDDDCYLESDILDAYKEVLTADPCVEVLEGAIGAVGLRPNGNHHAPLNLEGDKLWSCNFALKRRSIRALGRFRRKFSIRCYGGLRSPFSD